jgi:tetratricopeptide (TPR) repeat protein
MNKISNKYYVPLICIALTLISLAVYLQVLNYDFVDYDDEDYVTRNPQVISGITWKGVLYAFKETDLTANWHPLTWLSHMLDCQLFGLNPLGHHMTSLLFHIANTLLLFLIFRKMTDAIWPSFFVAAVFALHPLHVESVAWVAERKDVLSGFFWMLTIAAYIRYTKHPCLIRYLPVFLAFSMGLMAKPMVVTLPFVLLLLDYWPLGRLQLQQQNDRENLPQSTTVSCSRTVFHLVIEKIPLFILAAASSIVTFLVQRSAGAMIRGENYSLNTRISNAFVSYLGYIIKMVYPSRLAVLYPHPGDNLPVWQPVVSFLIIAMVSVGVIYTARRYRYLTVGWFWYLGTLVPVIGLIQIGSQAMADRYTYLPSIGIFIIVAWSVAELTTKCSFRNLALGVTAGIVLVSLSICTLIQLCYWRNTLTLYEHTLKVTENNYIIHNNYGCSLDENGKLDQAIKNFNEALRIKPNYVAALINLGVAMKKKGKITEAIEKWERVLELNPYNPSAHSNLGLVMAQQGKYNEAIKHFNDALQAKPNFPGVHYILGIIYDKMGNYDMAIQNYNNVIRLEPSNLDARFNLALTCTKMGRYDSAIQNYNDILQINPNHAGAINNLGMILKEQGKISEAVKKWERVLQIEPDNLRVHFNIGLAMAEQGKYDLAIKHYIEALRIEPDWPELLEALADSYAAAGDFSKAIETAEKALALCQSSEQNKLKKDIENRLALYKAGKPYNGY